MLHFYWSLAAFIIAMGILITVHEFGHFLLARLCGVAIERFSIGYGRALWHRYDKYGTEFVIAIVPIGGYVKMLDKRDKTTELQRRHEVFNYKTIWQRAVIIASGPIFNFIFAIFAYWLVFMIGIPTYRPIIGDVILHSIASQAKILPGMEFKSIDGIETPDWDSVRLQIINKIGDSKTSISVATLGTSKVEMKTLDLRSWNFDLDKQDPIISLGIIPDGPHIEPIIAQVQKNSAAAKAGFQNGDKIIKVDGQLVNSWPLFLAKVKANPGRMLKISIERHGDIIDIILTTASKQISKHEVEGFAGIAPKITPLPIEYKIFRQFSPLPALTQACEKTWQLIRLTISMLGKLVTGDIKINNLSGPISIAQGAGISAEYGLIYYLMFLSLISINLGVINLLPLPVLDGGHLFFLVIEKLKGEPVSERIQNFLYRIGSILLLLLMSLALFNDFSRL